MIYIFNNDEIIVRNCRGMFQTDTVAHPVKTLKLLGWIDRDKYRVDTCPALTLPPVQREA
jgi:hypothetical protein